jgi:DNA-binding transcriptional LysR family regulator
MFSREEIMENRISQYEKENREQEDRRRGEPQPIAAILAELLAQYQTRFPEVRIAVVETPAVAV